MRTGLARSVSLATAAGVLAVVAGLGASLPRGDEPGDQEKSAAAKGAAAEKKPAPPKPRIAVFRLAGDLTERPPDETFSFGSIGGTSLRELIDRMKKAGEDANVKAVVFLHEGGSVGAGQAEELRARDGQAPGQGQGDLRPRRLARRCGSTSCSRAPRGSAWSRRPTCGSPASSAKRPISAACSTRSASSPSSSPAAPTRAPRRSSSATGPAPKPRRCRTGCSTGCTPAPSTLIAQRPQGRRPEKVREWIDGGPYSAEKARAAGLIDAVEHRQDFEAMLKGKYGKDVVFDKKYGQKQQPKLDFSSPFAVFKLWGEMMGQGAEEGPTKPAVAIVYVEGPITLGGGQPRSSPRRPRRRRRSARRSTRRRATTRSRPSCCGSIRPAARPSPARSSSTPPAA